MQKLDYHEKLYERLQWLTKDDFSLLYFFNDENPDLCVKENKKCLEATVEFIYRCIKCKLLEFNIGYEYYDVTNLEELAERMSRRPLKFSQLSDDDVGLWFGEQLWGTKLLDQIADDCQLVGYSKDVNFSDPRWHKFRMTVEQLFSDNGLPWDLENPLFPVS